MALSTNTRRRLLRVTHFTAGGVGYGALEIVWRGYTHVSMLLAGGVGLLLLFRLASSRLPLPLLCAAGTAAITGIELAAGCVVNLWLGLGVWDYSDMQLHLWGQVCALYTVLWGGLCAVMLPVCRAVLRFEQSRQAPDLQGAALSANTKQS